MNKHCFSLQSSDVNHIKEKTKIPTYSMRCNVYIETLSSPRLLQDNGFLYELVLVLIITFLCSEVLFIHFLRMFFSFRLLQKLTSKQDFLCENCDCSQYFPSRKCGSHIFLRAKSLQSSENCTKEIRKLYS